MHPIKRLFYVTLSVLVLTAGIWTAYADSEKNPGRETIRVGFFATDGLHMIDDGGEKSGYGYALLRYMSRYLDVSYESVGYDKSWAEMLRMLDDGEIDMVTFANKTEERKEKYDFSRPIGFFGTALFVREDNRAVIPGIIAPTKVFVSGWWKTMRKIKTLPILRRRCTSTISR